MYDKLPKWLIKDCPAEYCLTEEPGDDRDNKIKELISVNPDLKDLRFGNSFCIHVDKVPMAKTNDIRTFTTFKKAKELLSKAQQTYKGKNVGLGIGLFRPFCGIDIDHCIDDDGVVADTAQEIIHLFDGAYIETSMSGTGIHIIFLVPVEDQQKSYKNYFTKMNGEACKSNGFSDIGGLEFYQGMYDNRYLTLTGNIIPSTKEEYTFNKDKIKQFLSTYMCKPQPTTPAAPSVEFDSSDDEDKAWFYWALFNNMGKLQELYSKEATGSGATESEDDFELLKQIALFSNFNPSIMDRAFSLSKNDFTSPAYSKMWFYGKDFYFDTKDEKHKNKWLVDSDRYYSKLSISNAINDLKVHGKQATKVYFKDSFYYDEESKKIKSKKGGETMIKIYKLIKKDGTVVPDVYNFRKGDIGYTVRVAVSKEGKLYCKDISAYSYTTKQKLGYIDRKKLDENNKEVYNSEFYNLQDEFLEAYRNSDLD